MASLQRALERVVDYALRALPNADHEVARRLHEALGWEVKEVLDPGPDVRHEVHLPRSND